MTVALAAFLVADILLFVLYMAAQDDDPSSPNYVPPDWKSLVMMNLGLQPPANVPSHLQGNWIDEAGNNCISFKGMGKFDKTEFFEGTRDIKLQAQGTVISLDGQLLSVRSQTLENIRLGDKLVQNPDGSFSIDLDGKRYRRASPARSTDL